MNYWLTTHWPPYEDDPADFVDREVWLYDGVEAVGDDLARDDVVLIYQSQTGRTLIGTTSAGDPFTRPRRSGRGGIVAVSTALGSFSRFDDESARERYSDGTRIWWRWRAPLQMQSRSGFVSRSRVSQALGYSPGYNYRAFGDRHSGLKKLTQQQYAELLHEFLESRSGLPAPPAQGADRHPEGGEESDAHRDLKHYVAADPVSALGQDGLRTLAVEYAFPTQDRADIVLEDRYGRVVGLEVEVDCGPSHVAGILQAVKYRRMLEVLMRRAHNDGRAMLVAYSVCPEVRAVCEQYEVEVIAIPRADVARRRQV